jgi:hypothetical protein
MANPVLQPQLPKVARTTPRGETCRMFESDFLERFSRIHPATPFVVWGPVAAAFVVRSILRHDIPTLLVPALFVLGMFAWTLAEYFLHKYVFHWTNDTPAGKRIHFLLHGVHHDYPNDKDRLVMPLLTSVPLSVIFYSLFTFLLGRAMGEPFSRASSSGTCFTTAPTTSCTTSSRPAAGGSSSAATT